MADQITGYTGTIPNRSQSQSAFDTNADNYLDWLVNTFVDDVNTLSASVEADAASAEASNTAAAAQVTLATTQAGNAAASATEAAISAGLNNFQGSYSAGTTYAQADSVVYSGLYYISLVGSNTGNTPDTATAYWQPLVQSPDIKTYTASVFESAATNYISVAALSSTKVIACYSDGGDLNKGKAIILDISGTTITPDTAVEFESGAAFYCSVAKLSSTQAIVAYQDNSDSSKGKACILDVAGSTITPETPVEFEAGSTSHPKICALSSSQAIVCYVDVTGSSYPTTCVLGVAGSTITPETPVVIQSSAASFIGSVDVISSTKMIVAYSGGGSSNSNACIIDISGSTATPATPLELYNGTSTMQNNQIVALDSSTMAMAFQDSSSAGACYLTYLSLSGSTLSYNGEGIAISQGSGTYKPLPTPIQSLVKIDSTTIMLLYSHGAWQHTEAALIKYDSGTGFKVLATRIAIQNIINTADFTPTVLLDTGTMLMAYDNDADGNSYGMAKIVKAEGY